MMLGLRGGAQQQQGRQRWRPMMRVLLALCLNLSCTVQHCSCLPAGSSQASALLSCINDGGSCADSPTTWGHLLGDKPSCFTAQRAWWSAKPAGLQVTLLTQLSLNRLPQLKAQCAVWKGPLAAVVYLPLTGWHEKGKAREALESAVAQVSPGPCMHACVAVHLMPAWPPKCSQWNYAFMCARTCMLVLACSV